jgi:hypothetical protein
VSSQIANLIEVRCGTSQDIIYRISLKMNPEFNKCESSEIYVAVNVSNYIPCESCLETFLYEVLNTFFFHTEGNKKEFHSLVHNIIRRILCITHLALL